MRASKEVKSEKLRVKSANLKHKTQNFKLTEIHISGAEGLYYPSEIQSVVRKYIERAISHPKGRPDKIILSIEDIKEKPKEIQSLQVRTVHSQTPSEAKDIATRLLQASGVSEKAIHAALKLIKKGGLRGASLISAEKAERLEPDRQRGVRVSRLGVDRSAYRLLSSRLSQYGVNTDTVKEALILASKVTSSKEIIAELCISDDPGYTTGYIASKKFGYVRIPNIKLNRSKTGGRAFFVKEGLDVGECISYLERKPVMIKKVSPCMGTVSIDEIINSTYK
jgi:6-carboxyhexanoate--CoA ligase